MASKWRSVISDFRPSPWRISVARSTTMAKPENIAPTTK